MLIKSILEINIRVSVRCSTVLTDKLIELPIYSLLLLLYLSAYMPLKDFKSFFNNSTVDFSWIFLYVLKRFGPDGLLTSYLPYSTSSSEVH